MPKKLDLKHLTERGGVGLVVFHLARRKIEFALTSDRSPLGDIWADVNGRKIGIEVKACRDAMKWQIRRSQVDRVEFYILVSLDTAKCFVLTSREMAKILREAPLMYGDIHLVDKSLIDGRALNAWGKLDGESSPNLSVGILGPRPIHRLTYKSTRRVRRTLADGTVKIYVYPGTKDTSTDNADIVAALAM